MTATRRAFLMAFALIRRPACRQAPREFKFENGSSIKKGIPRSALRDMVTYDPDYYEGNGS